MALRIEQRIARLERNVRQMQRATLSLVIHASNDQQWAIDRLRECDPDSQIFVLIRAAIEVRDERREYAYAS